MTELATELPPIALPIADVAPPRTALRPLELPLVTAGESVEAVSVSVAVSESQAVTDSTAALVAASQAEVTESAAPVAVAVAAAPSAAPPPSAASCFLSPVRVCQFSSLAIEGPAQHERIRGTHRRRRSCSCPSATRRLRTRRERVSTGSGFLTVEPGGGQFAGLSRAESCERTRERGQRWPRRGRQSASSAWFFRGSRR